MRIGIVVTCAVCGDMKKPVGRSGPLGVTYCEPEWDGNGCPGYWQEPMPGSLWPGETSEDFGYPCGTDGTVEGADRAQEKAMTEQDWIAANAPGGWIDDLRRERDTLKAALLAARNHLEIVGWSKTGGTRLRDQIDAALAACVPPQETEK